MQNINLPLERDRATAFGGKPIAFTLTDSRKSYLLDPAAERPRVQPASGSAPGAALAVQGPDEEIVRFLSGRHFLPGTQSNLNVSSGRPQDLAALRRAFR